jgi:transposase-like protein
MGVDNVRGPGPGIPAPASENRATPRCPFCGSDETELMSLFGSSALTSQYYCRGCRSAFEQVKWGTPPPPAVRPRKAGAVPPARDS